jgi:predicted SAM-dependent methyltransferase
MLRPGLREKLRCLRSSFVGLSDYTRSEACYGRDLRRHCKGKSGLLLNIGCGQLAVDGWVNVDYQPIQGRSFYLDVRNGLPLSAGSARHIHCEHFLEHLDFSEAKRFLCECARVLEDTGTMRVIVPDLERYIIAYARNDQSFFDGFRFLGGAAEALETKGAVCNQMFRMGGAHKFAWDFETLRYASHICGFSNTKRSALGDIPSELDIDGRDVWRPLESLYVNIFKS